MDVALIVIVAVLFVLVGVVALKGRRARRAAREHEHGKARIRADKARGRHEESQRRQADVKAAHQERASESVSTPTDRDAP